MRGASVTSSLLPVRRRFVGSRTFSDFFRPFSSSEVTRERERASSVVSTVRVSLRVISRYRGDLEQRQMWRSERRDRQQVRIELELRRHSRAKMTFLDLFVATKIEVGPRPFIVESESRVRTNVGCVELISNEYVSAESTLSESSGVAIDTGDCNSRR